jgi:uncharacterized Zn finger protein (UPF0148 family)
MVIKRQDSGGGGICHRCGAPLEHKPAGLYGGTIVCPNCGPMGCYDTVESRQVMRRLREKRAREAEGK